MLLNHLLSLAIASLAASGSAALKGTDGNCPEPTAPETEASTALEEWVLQAMDDTFPHGGQWEDGFHKSFSTDLHATFNQTEFDIDGWKELYVHFDKILTAGYGEPGEGFEHNFASRFATPNLNDLGGFALLIGVEGGTLKGEDESITYDHGAYIKIDDENGERKITEIRIISNLPNSGTTPSKG